MSFATGPCRTSGRAERAWLAEAEAAEATTNEATIAARIMARCMEALQEQEEMKHDEGNR